MTLNNKDTKRFTSQFIDEVLSVDTNVIRAPNTPHHGKDIWDLVLSERKIVLLPELLEDKDFLKLIEDNEVLGKRFTFTILKKGRYLISAKQN